MKNILRYVALALAMAPILSISFTELATAQETDVPVTGGIWYATGDAEHPIIQADLLAGSCSFQKDGVDWIKLVYNRDDQRTHWFQLGSGGGKDPTLYIDGKLYTDQYHRTPAITINTNENRTLVQNRNGDWIFAYALSDHAPQALNIRN